MTKSYIIEQEALEILNEVKTSQETKMLVNQSLENKVRNKIMGWDHIKIE